MKLADILLLGLTLAFLIIGVDQTIVLGFSEGYWAFMLSLVLFFVYNFRKNKKMAAKDDTPAASPRSSKRDSKKPSKR